MRYYLDEDLSHRIAVIGRRLGLDIVSSHECGQNGNTDAQQLLFAAQEGRCFVSQDVKDIPRQSKRFEEDGLPHPGVVMVPLSLDGRRFAAVARALARFDEQYPDGIPPYSVFWLDAAG
ncbi:MAG: DUF5615 family PIN-like protein [Dehalococcoidia bacterium]